MADITEMSDKDFDAFLAQQSGLSHDPTEPNEENLVRLFSDMIRAQDPSEKANMLVDVANMSMALADKTLGAQSLVAKCLVLHRQQH